MQISKQPGSLAVMEEEFRQEQVEFHKDNLHAINTKKSYQADLRVFDRWLLEKNIRSDEVTSVFLEQFFLDMSKTRKISTVERYRASISHVLPDLIKSDAIIKAFKCIRRKKKDITVSSTPLLKDEFLEKWHKIKSLKYKLFLVLQYKGALRVSELLGLELKDVDIESDSLTLHFVDSKTGAFTSGIKNGIVDVVSLFKKYVAEEEISGKLFSFTRDAVLKWVKRNFGKQYSTHSVRSGHITSAIDANIPIPAIMKRSRHKNASVFVNHYYTPATLLDNPSDLI